MSYKSRGNWKTGVCLKSDCTNRDKACDRCIRFSEYTGKIEEVKPTEKKIGSTIPMPLEEWCERRPGNKCGKGSWPRSIDPKGEDFGAVGCRSGLGIYHPMTEEGRCKHCGKTKEEIKKVQEG